LLFKGSKTNKSKEVNQAELSLPTATRNSLWQELKLLDCLMSMGKSIFHHHKLESYKGSKFQIWYQRHTYLLVDLPMHHDMQFTSILHWVFFWSLISCLWIQKKHLMTGDNMVAQAYLLVDLSMYYDKEFTSILHCGIFFLVSHLMLVDSEEAFDDRR
jgi:hypothetical protein